MTTEEVAINLLSDHTCDNCDYQRAANKCSIKCPEECTCKKWIERKLEAPWYFSIPKNPCGEVETGSYSKCTLCEVTLDNK